MEELLQEAASIKEKSKPYTDSRYPDYALETWKILKHDSPLLDKIMEDFGVKGSPRYYWQDANSTLPMHTDNGTTCSINFVLTPNPAPVTIEEEDYVYTQCLLNTTKLHGVKTNDEDRILLKISIFDESFEDLTKRLPYIKDSVSGL